MQKQTRENWLNAAAAILLDEILEPAANQPTPKMRYSLTAPSSKAAKQTVLGSCWSDKASSDQTFEIFITARLDCTDSVTILATLLHEQVHAFVGIDAGHGPEFQSLAKAVGLVGGETAKAKASFTATKPSDQLTEMLEDIIESIGPIPHAALDPNLSGQPKQTNRQKLMFCQVCDFKFRASQKCIDQITNHTCPACQDGDLIQENK